MNYSGHIVVTAPTEEPISLLRLREHSKITWDLEDDVLAGIIASARAHLEGFIGPIITQTHDVYWSGYPCGGGALALPWGAVSGVTQFEHVAPDGTGTPWTVSGVNLQLSSVTVAHLDTLAKPAVVRLAYNQNWPTLELRTLNPVRARVVCGFGAQAAVPVDIVHAMLLLCEHWHKNRSDESATVPRQIAFGVQSLIRRYRRLA